MKTSRIALAAVTVASLVTAPPAGSLAAGQRTLSAQDDRRREVALRADAYAIRLTGGADAFVTSMRRLAHTNLVDDQPPRLARVLSSHPPVRDRVLAALRQAEHAARTQGAVASRPG